MRRTGYIWKHPKPCSWCGTKAKRYLEYYRGPLPYNGNFQVIRSDKHFDTYTATLWDGQSYAHKHDFFCSDRCAITYADRNELSLLQQ